MHECTCVECGWKQIDLYLGIIHVCLPITIAESIRIENARESKAWLIIPIGIEGHKLVSS